MAASGQSQELVPAEAAGVDLSVHKSGIVPTLQNIVATVNLDTKLDLKTIALTARNAEYNPKVLGNPGNNRQNAAAHDNGPPWEVQVPDICA